VQDPDPADTTYIADFALMLREPDGSVRVVGDRHVLGVFSEATWLAALEAAGFAATVDHGDGETPQPVFVGMRRS
jgi:hypothetical protein